MNNTKYTGLLGLVLVALVAVLYGQFLRNPLVFDDLYFFLLDSDGNQLVSSYQFDLFELRSLPYATLAWTKVFFGLSLIPFRVGNLVLHAATVLVLFVFLSTLFAAVLVRDKSASGMSPRLSAFFATLLFALHPVATYAAGYLVQRTIVMATLFSLLALWVYLRGSLRQKPVLLWLSVPFYYLAVFSKEHAIMLPAVMLSLTILIHKDWRDRLKQRWPIFAALALITMFVVLARKGVLGSVYEIDAPEMLRLNESELAYPLSVVTQAGLFFKYAFLWVLPDPAWMSIDMREPFARTLFSSYLIVAAGFLAWGAGAIWLLLKRENRGLAGFALLFPWLMFFTEFSSVRIQEVFVLYRSYIWAPGAFCLLPVIFFKLNGRMVVLILTLFGLTLFLISMDRLMTLSHPALLWDDAEKLVKNRTDLPGVQRIYYNRGTEFVRIGKLDRGIDDLKHAISLDKDYVEAHVNLGAAYYKKKEWIDAVTSFNKATEIYNSRGKDLQPFFVHQRAQALENIGDLKRH